MRIAIIGNGAVGGVLANRLQTVGHSVTLYTKSKMATLESIVVSGQEVYFQSPQNKNIDTYEGEAFDLTFLAVKIYHLTNTIKEYAPLLNNSNYTCPSSPS